VFSAWSVQSDYEEDFRSWQQQQQQQHWVESSSETPACRDMSLGAAKLNWVSSSELAVAENGEKGIRRYKEAFMCDLICYKCVSRIRLVKTENSSACVTVNCKLFRSAIPSCVYKVSVNPVIQCRTVYSH
jgi:hypothetical protein